MNAPAIRTATSTLRSVTVRALLQIVKMILANEDIAVDRVVTLVDAPAFSQQACASPHLLHYGPKHYRRLALGPHRSQHSFPLPPTHFPAQNIDH